MRLQDMPENLSAAALYRRDLAETEDLRTLTEDEKNALVERARQGDGEARSQLITRLLHRVSTYAARYMSAYAWVSSQMTYLDLVQVGSEALLSALDSALDHASNVYAYLTIAAQGEIRKYAKRFDTLITTPGTDGAVPLTVGSLDAPLSPERSESLFDLIPDAHDENYSDSLTDSGPLYEALRRLPIRLRATLVQSFSLFPGDPAWELEYTHPVKNLTSTRPEALDELYRHAAALYPQLCTGLSRPEKMREHWWEQESSPLTAEQRQRLDQARAALLSRGEPVSHATLRREAQMYGRVLSRYLSEVKEPPLSREQRLAEAYTKLSASGQPVGVKRLALEAKASTAAARSYLERKCPRPSREERVSLAYARLEAEGKPITTRTLGKAAQVGSTFLQQWLPAKRLADGYVLVRQKGLLSWVKSDESREEVHT